MAIKSAFSGDEGLPSLLCTDSSDKPAGYPAYGTNSGKLSPPDSVDNNNSTFFKARGLFTPRIQGSDLGTGWIPKATGIVSFSGKEYYGRWRCIGVHSELLWTASGVSVQDEITIAVIFNASLEEAWRVRVKADNGEDTTDDVLLDYWNGGAWASAVVFSDVYSISKQYYMEFFTDNQNVNSAGNTTWEFRIKNETDDTDIASSGGLISDVARRAESSPAPWCDYNTVGVDTNPSMAGYVGFWDVSHNNDDAGGVTGWLSSSSGNGIEPYQARVASYYPTRDDPSNNAFERHGGLGPYAWTRLNSPESILFNHSVSGLSSMHDTSEKKKRGIKGLSSGDNQAVYFDLPDVTSFTTIYGVQIYLALEGASPSRPTEIGMTLGDAGTEYVFTSSDWQWAQDEQDISNPNGTHLWVPMAYADKGAASMAWTMAKIRGSKIRIKGVTGLITQLSLNVLCDFAATTDVDRESVQTGSAGSLVGLLSTGVG